MTRPAGAFTGPLRASANQRYLVDGLGKPFFIHGEAAWAAVANLTEAEAIAYLDDLARRRFNAVMVDLIEHKFSKSPPANALGVKPFSGVAFQSTASSAYMAHVRWFLQQAARRDIVVFANPAYLGSGGGDEGWHQELEAASIAQARAWGTFVATSLAQERNLVWHLFGDFEPPSHAKTNAVRDGLATAVPSLTLFSHHFERGKSSTEAREPWLTWNYVYPPAVGYMHAEVLTGYNAAPHVPQILGEGYYEADPQLATTEDVRRQAWGALTSGAAGHFYGHRHIWGFGNGFEPADWRKALDAPGRTQMAVVVEFFQKRAWWLLAPDQNDSFVTSGRGSRESAGYVTAALASDRSWGLLYLPGRSGTVSVNRAQLAGRLASSWLDPRTGKSTPIATSANTGIQRFVAPDENDWVLVLETIPAAAPVGVPTLPRPGTQVPLLCGLLVLVANARRRTSARVAAN